MAKLYEKRDFISLIERLDLPQIIVSKLLQTSKAAVSQAANPDYPRRTAAAWDPWLERLENVFIALESDSHEVEAQETMKQLFTSDHPAGAWDRRDPSEGWRRVFDLERSLLGAPPSEPSGDQADRIDELSQALALAEARLRQCDSTVADLRDEVAGLKRRLAKKSVRPEQLSNVTTRDYNRFWKMVALLNPASNAADTEVAQAIKNLRRILERNNGS